VAKEGLNFCNRLFAIERELHDVTPKESYDHRLKFSRPLLDDFLAWLKSKSPQVLPKSKLGDAVQYCLNQWTKLEAFLLDGRLEIDNNRALSSGLENPQVWAGAA
jgi:transposase